RMPNAPKASEVQSRFELLAEAWTWGTLVLSLAIATTGITIGLNRWIIGAIVPLTFAAIGWLYMIRVSPLGTSPLVFDDHPPRVSTKRHRLHWAEALLLIGATTTTIAALLAALTPEVRFDPLAYHLSIPQLWLNIGNIADVPENGHSYFPYGY